jgi:hypothetical protein
MRRGVTDEPDRAAAGCLTAILQVLGAWFLFDWAAEADRAWLERETAQRDDDTLRWIALQGAPLAAARWNAIASEFPDDPVEREGA